MNFFFLISAVSDPDCFSSHDDERQQHEPQHAASSVAVSLQFVDVD
jgi:hypothetical protein